MKKSIIAASAASLAVAAMPVVGVFAATSTVVDTITTVLPDSCTIYSTDTQYRNPSAETPTSAHTIEVGNMRNGQLKTNIAGTAMTITCNGSQTATWKLEAVGTGTGTTGTEMVGTSSATNIIDTNTNTSGPTSGWAMKMSALTTAEGTTAYDGGSDSYIAIPANNAASKQVAHGAGSNTITSNYQIYAGPTQAADTYTGIVTYTLTNPAN